MRFAFLWVTLSLAPAGDLDRPVTLETRWWSAREFGFRIAEATGVRFAVADGISGRARVGGRDVAASKLLAEFEAQTRIRGERLGGVLVFHRPDEARRRELEATLSAGGNEAERAAWLLGWLKDARAWPALARAATGPDPRVALAAAQALRRLDGEEDFDLRRWVLPIYHDPPPDGGLWQVPLGACFATTSVEPLLTSPWVALREAAARLAPGAGAAGKALAERLKEDPSLPIRLAAQRSLRAWESPPKPSERTVKPPDLAAERANLQKAGPLAKTAAARLATYGTEEDFRHLAELAAVGGESGSWPARGFAENGGGDIALATLRKEAARPLPYKYAYAYAKYGLTMLLDGENLARELGPLLGQDTWNFSSELALARFAGPAALPFLRDDSARPKPLVPRGHVVPLAIGFIGGPEAVALLATLVESRDLNTAHAAARGLGDAGALGSVPPLAKQLGHPERLRRHRAVLALGRIGGPEAGRALAALLETEKDPLVRRALVSMLTEIGGSDRAALEKTEKELSAFVPRYEPRNPKFGPDFPVGRWVERAEPYGYICGGETRIAFDPFTGILFDFGG